MKLLIVGKNGQVGSALETLCRERGIEAIALGRAELDLHSPSQVHAAVERIQPTHIVNAAAYNNVDRAEEEPFTAYRTNTAGPEYLAAAARKRDAVLLHYSTDYVFDGRKGADYDEGDATNPLSVYGHSKLLGEREVLSASPRNLVLRTAWVFSPGGNNFVERLLARARRGDELAFVDDVTSSPTAAVDVAHATLELIARGADGGVYHVSGRDGLTPYRFARLILRHAGIDAKVRQLTSGQLQTLATRPQRSTLATRKIAAFGITMPGAVERLEAYFRA